MGHDRARNQHALYRWADRAGTNSAVIPAARTLAFTAGWLAQIAIIASILRWI